MGPEKCLLVFRLLNKISLAKGNLQEVEIHDGVVVAAGASRKATRFLLLLRRGVVDEGGHEVAHSVCQCLLLWERVPMAGSR
jgi:hypothetical protein